MTMISAALECASPDMSIGVVIEAIGRVWRRVTVWIVCLRGTWRSVRLSSVADLPQIIRSGPCRPNYEIIFPNVAAMKAWKRLTTILKARGDMWTTKIMRQL
jgi:hypothetical protein